MQAAAFRYSDCSCELIWCPGPSPPSPPGISLRHACWAAWKWGLPEIDGLTAIATFTSLPLVVTFGSGKFGTPCARMHAEYATAWLSGELEPLCEPLELDDELPGPGGPRPAPPQARAPEAA